MEFTAKQLAQVLKGTVEGDPQVKVTSFAKIEHGKPGQLCFYANPKYEKYVYTCKAGILLVNKDFQPKEAITPTLIRVDDAYKSLADLLKYAATQKRTDRRHRGFRSSWGSSSSCGWPWASRSGGSGWGCRRTRQHRPTSFVSSAFSCCSRCCSRWGRAGPSGRS